MERDCEDGKWMEVLLESAMTRFVVISVECSDSITRELVG
jgi:hypothetical protein